MIYSYVKLGIASLLPVIFAIVLYLIDKKTKFGTLDDKIKQVIYGVVFGILAIIGTEWGIPLNGAQVNCRDSAVLTAGLMFGAPAGLIAGLIGGIERWIGVWWGVGRFTRLACSLSTIIAGVYAAVLRKYMFENKKPSWSLSLAIGIVMEVFHLTMVFITNMNEPTQAMAVVKACTVPMVTANGLSVMFASLAIGALSNDIIRPKQSKVRIAQTIQRWLLVTVVLAFVATSVFVYSFQDAVALTQTDNLLSGTLRDVADDVEDASDKQLLTLTNAIYDDYRETNKSLVQLATEYGVAEISLIDNEGFIYESTDESYVGFDMRTGEQSAEFLCLLQNNGPSTFVQAYGPITGNPSVLRKYAGQKTDFGFIQVGYDAEQFQNSIAERVEESARNRHIGETGYLVILVINQDDTGKNTVGVISAPTELIDDIDISQLDTDNILQEDVTHLEIINGKQAYCRYTKEESFYIISVLPQEEALQMRNIALYVNTFMEILVFAILFALVYLLIKKVVVDQIKNINTDLSKITDGNLDVVVNVRTNEEFASLSDDINLTVDTLKNYIDEASARIDQELEFAQNIQYAALPAISTVLAKRKDFDIFASMNPAKEVGGDFYDFYVTENDVLNFVIADVSGKGIPAAMFMMRAKTELKSLAETSMDLADVFTNSNVALCEGNDAGMFVTAWQGQIDLNTGVVTYANAGHNPPLVRHANGQFEYLRSRAGFILAGMDGVRYKTQQIQLQPNDIIYLYTDGVTEATNVNNELFGEQRLLQTINSIQFDNMKELCTAVKNSVDEFVGDAPQFDDITMVALKFIGTPPSPKIHFDNASFNDIPVVTEFVEAELEKIDCPMKVVTQINIAVDELYSNIVRYGYPTQDKGPVTVEIKIKEEPRAVYVKFVDEGIPYNPLTKADPDITLSAEERQIGGLGIFMVKKTMDDIKYRYENNKNILTIKKVF